MEITNHAAERYAERIANREELSDINTYVKSHFEKIKADISKMLEYSTLLYEGKTGKKDAYSLIYLSGTWIIHVDKNGTKVITLYKIDLGVGEEFNKEYVKLAIDKINKAKDNLEAKKALVQEENEIYKKKIKECDYQISEFKERIKALEALKASNQEALKYNESSYANAETELRDCIDALISK